MKVKNPKLRKAYKATVELDEESSAEVWFLSCVMVRLWNMALDQAELWIQNKEKRISNISFNYWLTGVRTKKVMLENGQLVDLGSVSSDCEREILRKLAGSYSSYFELRKKKDKRARKPQPRSEERFQTISWSAITICDEMLIVPAYDDKRLKIPLTPYLMERIEGKQVVHATISRDDEGRFVLSLVTASPLPPQIEHPSFFRAIDLGAGDVAVVDSDGTEFLIPSRRPDKYWFGGWKPISLTSEDKALLGLEDSEELERFVPGPIWYVERRLEGRVRGSKGSRRLLKARRLMHKKAGDQRKSYQRKLARALVKENIQCIVIGKAQVRLGLAQSEKGAAKQHYGAQNTGYLFRLLLYVKEKAQERGVPVIELDDPQRKGEVDNPENKFYASRELLAQVMRSKGLEPPIHFTRKHFTFKQ